MNVVGVIAEYNPFHKGHAYHLAEAKKRANADYAVVIMSGNFTQRGIPACYDKFFRTECALSAGADLVLELPFCYATSSAELFASGAVNILDRLGVVTDLCFGSDSGEDADLYLATADFLCKEPKEYRERLRSGMKDGLTFPQARMNAAKDFISSDALSLLSAPNAILGLEYCKALLRSNSSVRPLPIARIGSGYLETSLSADDFPSATAIRLALSRRDTSDTSFTDNPADALFSAFPESTLSLLQTQKPISVFPEDFFLLLRYALLHSSPDIRKETADFSTELSHRLASLTDCLSYEELVTALKTRQYTRTRIERALLHLLCRYSEADRILFQKNSTGYARVLGFRKDAAPLLRSVKENASLPVIGKLAQNKKRCSSLEQKMLSYDLTASKLYQIVAEQKSGIGQNREYAGPIIY